MLLPFKSEITILKVAYKWVTLGIFVQQCTGTCCKGFSWGKTQVFLTPLTSGEQKGACTCSSQVIFLTESYGGAGGRVLCWGRQARSGGHTGSC